MASRSVFLDTNIVADMIDPKRLHYREAMELLRKLVIGNYRAVISEDMLSTLYFISSDKRATLEFFEHIAYRHWDVVPYGDVVIREATRLSLATGQDLEDTLQCLCAKQEGCALILTEDKGFVDCGVEVIDYAGFLL